MFKILPSDRKFFDSPDVGHRDCICSRCGERITKGIPIRAWGEDKNYEYRFHPSCFGIQETEKEFDDWDETPEDFEEYPDEDLGTCCVCGCNEGVINIVNLPYKTFISGTGWGNLLTGLPADGAIAVLCDRCFDNFEEKNLKDVVYGYATEKQRRPFSELNQDETFGD